MIRSILLKEYLKLRAPFLAALSLNMAVAAYVYTSMHKLFLMDPAELIWYRIIHIGTVFYEPFIYIPALTGTLIAFAQYLPETRSHRFRISLHLPLPPHLVVMGHVFVGLGAVLSILALDILAIGVMTATRFPHEVVTRTLVTVLPWMLAGLTAYIGTTLALLEPTWRLKIINTVIAAGLTGMFLWHEMPGAYEHVLPWLLLLTLLFVPSVLYPAYRFRYRRS